MKKYNIQIQYVEMEKYEPLFLTLNPRIHGNLCIKRRYFFHSMKIPIQNTVRKMLKKYELFIVFFLRGALLRWLRKISHFQGSFMRHISKTRYHTACLCFKKKSQIPSLKSRKFSTSQLREEEELKNDGHSFSFTKELRRRELM